MASNQNRSFEKIIDNLKSKRFSPVYVLHGEEIYFIDAITEYIEQNVLNESEKGFNQSVFYAKDSEPKTVIENARRFPMMASHQVIIVKEAQGYKSLDDFEKYLEKPVPSTILVLCFKGKKLDKRTKFFKSADKFVTYESTKLYDNELPNWIENFIKHKGFSIDNKSATVVANSLGSDLSKISNELEKLFINLGTRKEIQADDIEQYIGISKEFNSFELISAIAEKNAHRAFKISHHLTKAKGFSIIPFLAQMNNLFSKGYILSKTNTRDKQTIQNSFGLNYFQAQDCLNLVKNFTSNDIEKAIRVTADYDLKSKGIGSSSTPDKELMKELLVKIF